MIVVYLVADTGSRRTYRGFTVDLAQRLRRHRKEIRGGARYTSRFRGCRLLAYVRGFQTQRQALSFEWFTKGRRVRAYRPVPQVPAKLSRLVSPCLVRKFKPWLPELTVVVDETYCSARGQQALTRRYGVAVQRRSLSHENFTVEDWRQLAAWLKHRVPTRAAARLVWQYSTTRPWLAGTPTFIRSA